MRRLIFLAVLLLVIVSREAAAEIVGRATVIDGDTIDIRAPFVCSASTRQKAHSSVPCMASRTVAVSRQHSLSPTS